MLPIAVYLPLEIVVQILEEASIEHWRVWIKCLACYGVSASELEKYLQLLPLRFLGRETVSIYSTEIDSWVRGPKIEFQIHSASNYYTKSRYTFRCDKFIMDFNANGVCNITSLGNTYVKNAFQNDEIEYFNGLKITASKVDGFSGKRVSTPLECSKKYYSYIWGNTSINYKHGYWGFGEIFPTPEKGPSPKHGVMSTPNNIDQSITPYWNVADIERIYELANDFINQDWRNPTMLKRHPIYDFVYNHYSTKFGYNQPAFYL